MRQPTPVVILFSIPIKDLLKYSMSVSDQKLFQDFTAKLDFCLQTKTNILIISLPGLGASYFLQNYHSLHPQNVTYLNQPNLLLKNFNLLDLQPYSNFINDINRYFLTATTTQKFALAINSPSTTPSQHFYTTFYLPARNLQDTTNLVTEINPAISTASQIHHLSGGIPLLIKYFVANPDMVSQTPGVIAQQPEVVNLLSPLAKEIATTDTQTLEKLQIKNSNGWVSPVLALLVNTSNQQVNITINFDLTFTENGRTSPTPLNRLEKDILNFMLQHQNTITREQIADIKWGPGKYDQFSDLAIGKTMRRLAKKLQSHHLKTTPKIGYSLIPGGE